MTRQRRYLVLLGAALFLVSLPLPYWGVYMRAPAYPEQLLSLVVYPYRYGGTLHEWEVVGALVGVKVPPPIPEESLVVIPVVIAGLGLATLAVGFRNRLLRPVSILSWLVLLGLMAWAQYALYVFGHSLDPDRPLRYFEPFTPPVIGVLTLGKIQTYHVPLVGGFAFFVAAVLVTLAAWWPTRRAVGPQNEEAGRGPEETGSDG